MPHSKGWARKLVTQISKGEPENLLKRRSYRDQAFLVELYQYLNELTFHRPYEALQYARFTPKLAQLSNASNDLIAQSYAILGTAQLTAGEHQAADQSFETALSYPQSEAVIVDTYRRIVYLRTRQKRRDEALNLSLKAVRATRNRNNNEELAACLGAYAYILTDLREYPKALTQLGEGLTLIDPKDSTFAERIYIGLISNVAFILRNFPRYEHAKGTLAYIAKGLDHAKGQRRSTARYRLVWLEGLVYSNLGLHRQSERRLKISIEGFKALRMPYEIALASLDLGEIYLISQEWNLLEKLAKETYLRFQLVNANTEAIAALSQWLDAARGKNLTDQLTRQTRQIIESRVKPTTSIQPDSRRRA